MILVRRAQRSGAWYIAAGFGLFLVIEIAAQLLGIR